MCILSWTIRFVVVVFGTMSPAYHTYKAMTNNHKEEVVAWTKYWIVYAFLVSFEVITDILGAWMPLYMIMKLMVILWCVVSAPYANVWIFDSILNNILAKRQGQIDYILLHGKESILSSSVAYGLDLFMWSKRCIGPIFIKCWMKANQVIFGDHSSEKTSPPQTEIVLEAEPDCFVDIAAKDSSEADLFAACFHEKTGPGVKTTDSNIKIKKMEFAKGIGSTAELHKKFKKVRKVVSTSRTRQETRLPNSTGSMNGGSMSDGEKGHPPVSLD